VEQKKEKERGLGGRRLLDKGDQGKELSERT